MAKASDRAEGFIKAVWSRKLACSNPGWTELNQIEGEVFNKNISWAAYELLCFEEHKPRLFKGHSFPHFTSVNK